MHQAVFGMIGLGNIAQTQHLPNLLRSPHARMKSVCDVDAAKLEEAQNTYQVPHATTDAAELLADDEIQAVVIATRMEAHLPLTLAALGAGKSVYVEKPMAETNEECEAVVAAQRKAGKFVAVGFNRRFAPAYVKARQMIEQHGGAFNLHYRVADEYWHWGRGNPPGVRVIHEICHIFDLLRWLTGSEAESIYCVASRPDDEAIVVKMGSGCVATIMNSGFGSNDMPKEYIEVITERGGVTVEDFVELRSYGYETEEPCYRFPGHTHPMREFGYKYLYEKLGAEALRALRRTMWELEQLEERGELEGWSGAEAKRFLRQGTPGRNYTVDKGWLPAIDHFARCVATGDKPLNAGPEDALQASRLAHAAIQSRETGSAVRI